MINKSLPPEVKNGLIDVADAEMTDYSKTEPTTLTGKILRKIAKVLHIALPFLKHIKINKKP
jgi:hypothetical protein